MGSQAEAVKRFAREKRDSHEHPVETVLDWLSTLAAFLDGELAVEDEAAGLVVRCARPEWGVRTVEEGQAYLAFWERVAARHPLPVFRAAYAAALAKHRRYDEALTTFVDAVHDAPTLFIDHADELMTVADHCGEPGRLQFELAKLRFYRHLVSRGEMERAELDEATAEVIARFGRDCVGDALTKR